MFTLFKWLLWFCMPFTLILLCLFVLGAWFLWKRRFRLGAALLVLDLALIVLSLPAVANAIGYSLERRYPETPLAEIPKADAIVVLGGGMTGTDQRILYPEGNFSADRVVMAARLYHAGKAPVIIPSGCGVAFAEKPVLETMQVPSSAILCETEAWDTAENASYTVEILRKKGYKKVLLVTSAWHMPRSMMLFSAAKDVEFIPVGCDYEATLETRMAPGRAIWYKLPNMMAGGMAGIYVKEWLGILFYSFRKPKI